MEHYTYHGPVSQYNRVIAHNWAGATWASTKTKAISNLSFQYKSQNNLLAGAGGITLDAKYLKIK